MLSLLLQHNLIPYILVVLLGVSTYFLWEDNIDKTRELEESKAQIEGAYINMGIIQSYNEDRFNQLSKARRNTWKEGKHEGTF